MTHKFPGMLNLLILLVALQGVVHLAAQAPRDKATASNLITIDDPLQLRPSHITLSVANIDKEAEWYHDVLGFKEYERVKHGSDFEHCSLEIPGVYRVDLNWQEGSARHTIPGFRQSLGSGKGAGNMEQGYTHVVFKTPLSLDAVNRQLLAQHAVVAAAKDSHGAINNILVYDPEGNEIEIQHYDPGPSPIGKRR